MSDSCPTQVWFCIATRSRTVVLCHLHEAVEELLSFLYFNAVAFPPLYLTQELFGLELDLMWASQVQSIIILPQFLTFLLLLWTGRNRRCPCIFPSRITIIKRTQQWRRCEVFISSRVVLDERLMESNFRTCIMREENVHFKYTNVVLYYLGITYILHYC